VADFVLFCMQRLPAICEPRNSVGREHSFFVFSVRKGEWADL